jgi:hypothetical protein
LVPSAIICREGTLRSLSIRLTLSHSSPVRSGGRARRAQAQGSGLVHASEGITDGANDKKIDFIYLDRDAKRVIFAQGFLSNSAKDSAPANKASELNTAAAWLLSGDLESVPDTLRSVITDCRAAIDGGDVEGIELLFVHNLPESVNVARELQTAAQHLQKALDRSTIQVTARKLGNSKIEHLFATQESHIDVKDQIDCPSKVQCATMAAAGARQAMSILRTPCQSPMISSSATGRASGCSG